MEQLTPLLKELADKLGTTIEHLWKVLIQQTQVEIVLCNLWMGIALWGFGGLALLIFVFIIAGIIRDWDEEPMAFGFFVMIVLIIIGGLVYYHNYSDLLTLTKNPEYWALSEILNKLGH